MKSSGIIYSPDNVHVHSGYEGHYIMPEITYTHMGACTETDICIHTHPHMHACTHAHAHTTQQRDYFQVHSTLSLQQT